MRLRMRLCSRMHCFAGVRWRSCDGRRMSNRMSKPMLPGSRRRGGGHRLVGT